MEVRAAHLRLSLQGRLRIFLALSGLAQLAAWVFTILVILLNRKYYDSAVAPREMYDRVALWKVQTDWPHEYFRPSALTCDAERRLMLGDQFAIYAADLELIGESRETSVEDVIGKEEQSESEKPVKLLRTSEACIGGVRYRTVTLQPMILTSEMDRSWRSFGVLAKKDKLLLLNQHGTEVSSQKAERSCFLCARWRNIACSGTGT